MLKRLVLLSFLVLAACSTTSYTHGIPNLVQVRTDVWRSGQPTALDQWRYLYSIGIRHSIKLNFDSEGSDGLANLAGIVVYPVSIEPRTNADGLIPALVDVFERPAADRMLELRRLILEIKVMNGNEGAWLIHCQNGHDRTGLAVGMVRVLVDKWGKEEAYHEMLKRGFHPELIGLLLEWHALNAEK
jgi:hypothetical protein